MPSNVAAKATKGLYDHAVVHASTARPSTARPLSTLLCWALPFANLLTSAPPGTSVPPGTSARRSSAPASTAVAQDILSAPVIEVLTMSPGDALYTRWGHAALRVIDPATNLDAVFNYGSIDLSPGFMGRMLKGEVEAFLHVGRYGPMFATYAEREDRTIERRRLNLDPRAADRLMARLLSESTAPHWTYRYDHFADNCSSRVADVIDDALLSALSKAYASSPHPSTYRQLALSVLEGEPWLYVAVDIALSSFTDAPISRWDARFLPSELASLLDEAVLDGRPLVAEKEVIYRSKGVWNPNATHPWPWLWVYAFVTLPLLACFLRRRPPRLTRTLLALTGILTMLIGAGLLLLQLGTTYPFLRGNVNLFIFPISGVVLVMSAIRGSQPSRPRVERVHRICALTGAVALVSLCAADIAGVIVESVLPQCFTFIPVVFFLAFRRSSPGR